MVAALNILIALTMMVMEKTRDIAVMMSFGVTAEQVRRIFLLQGLLISVMGTVLGLVLGYAAEHGWGRTTGLFTWMPACTRLTTCRSRRGWWMRWWWRR